MGFFRQTFILPMAREVLWRRLQRRRSLDQSLAVSGSELKGTGKRRWLRTNEEQSLDAAENAWASMLDIRLALA